MMYTQVAVLNWFARLWEIDEEEYYGYITTCGTEGNLHGIYVGRENLPDGVLYASRESHYSVFKAARMYRMPAVKVHNVVYLRFYMCVSLCVCVCMCVSCTQTESLFVIDRNRL